jgi:hypothetical protein
MAVLHDVLEDVQRFLLFARWAKEGDFGRLVLGVDGYIGTYVDQATVIAPRPDNTFDWVDTVNYSEQVLGVDAAFDSGGLRLRAEGVLRWVKYHDGKSERIFTLDGSQQFLNNRLEYAGYVLAAYRTPWRIEAYAELEISSKSYTLPRYAGSSRASGAYVAALTPSIGFNVELTTHTLFKVQLAYMTAYKGNFTDRSVDLPVLFVRVVDSF